MTSLRTFISTAYYEDMFEKNTPRDFFLHAGAFISLYLAAIALITLFFSIINYAFPDALQPTYYYDPYSGPMRFAIASLIILAPLAIYLFFRIQRESRINPERKNMGIRRWLTYITLFITGATIIGDLIVLLNSFLGGALPTTFLLKVIVILGVMGAGFAYFFLDIKGYWVSRAQYSRYVGWGVIMVIVCSIIGGMMLMGSPMKQRELRLDNDQVMDLQSIQSMLIARYQQTGTLPADISVLESELLGYAIPESPEGRAPYIYTKKSELAFDLCATFAEPSVEGQSAIQEMPFRQPENWDHASGLACFTRVIDPAMLRPITKPVLPLN